MAQNVIYWKFDINTLYIRGTSASGYTEWIIPDSYYYNNVPWYSNRTTTQYVYIETQIDVTTIECWFYDCSYLTDITNFDYITNVTDINNCFKGCIYFNKSITIPNSVTNMVSCFRGCTSFNKAITIPNSVTSMTYCFSGCTSFNSQVTFQSPSSVTSMTYCFDGCTSFNQPITIPNSVTDMEYCFRECEDFNQSITIPNSVTYMESCFRSCTNFNQAITIPSSVTRMRYCFQGCTSLNSTITINSNSTYYGSIFTGTSLPIYIKGISKNLDTIANEYSNVSVKRSFLYRMLHYLTQLNAECDYLIRIAETSINVTTTFSSVLQSNLSGVTASTHSEYLIGNYLSVRAVINVNSTAQSTIGTGNVTNRILCTIKIPDFYYPSSGDTSYASLTNEQRFIRVSTVGSYSQAIPTGTSSGNAQPATFYITREYSGNDALIHFTIAANIVSTTQYELCVIVPVTRIPFNYSEV